MGNLGEVGWMNFGLKGLDESQDKNKGTGEGTGGRNQSVYILNQASPTSPWSERKKPLLQDRGKGRTVRLLIWRTPCWLWSIVGLENGPVQYHQEELSRNTEGTPGDIGQKVTTILTRSPKLNSRSCHHKALSWIPQKNPCAELKVSERRGPPTWRSPSSSVGRNAENVPARGRDIKRQPRQITLLQAVYVNFWPQLKEGGCAGVCLWWESMMTGKKEGKQTNDEERCKGRRESEDWVKDLRKRGWRRNEEESYKEG